MNSPSNPRPPRPSLLNAALIGLCLGLALLACGWYGVEPFLHDTSVGHDLSAVLVCHTDEVFSIGRDDKGVRDEYYCRASDGSARIVTSTFLTTTAIIALGSMAGGALVIPIALVQGGRWWLRRRRHSG